MKKTYYVYSIFEKLNLTTGLKSLIVLLMFSFCFLGSGTEASAQTLGTTQNYVDVDLTIFKNYDLKEDKDSANEIVRAALENLLDSTSPDGGVQEATYSSKIYFLNSISDNLYTGDTVLSSMMGAYTELGAYVGRFDDIIRTQIDLEDIADTYAIMLQ